MPLTSLSRDDADFSATGKYWRGSLWLPTAYAALKGLAEYGYIKEARAAAVKILEHMALTYKEYEPHTVWECYSPSEHKPAFQTNDKSVVRRDFCGWSALGPISVFIEFVLGFYEINAFKKTVKWNLPEDRKEEIGIKNLRFGKIVTDIIADGNAVKVLSNGAYKLVVNGKIYRVKKGENLIKL